MQLDFVLTPAESDGREETIAVAGRRIPVEFVRSARARRYIMRLRHDGGARVTIPRAGSAGEARRFAERCGPWLATQLERLQKRPVTPRNWGLGTEILFRGEPVTIAAVPAANEHTVSVGGEIVHVAATAGDLRPEIELHLRHLASRELPMRLLELARLHQATVRKVVVRQARSRWGSCSRQGTISLNWRLIQVPPFVRDYICLHELAHLRHMNHSRRFWREVERLCPDFRAAERWLKSHSALLR